MEKPNSITFFIPSTIEKLDQTTEPTIENLEGSDFLGNTIADGAQLINAMDSYSNRPFTAKDSSISDIWRIDAELDEREKAEFVMIDQHNLRESYAAATKEQIGIHHHTTSTFSSATQVVMEKEVSGKLGELQSLELDGVDDKTTASDSSEMDFGTDSFSVEILFTIHELTDGAVIFSKKDDLDDDLAGWLIHYRSSDNTFVFKASDGITDYSVSTGSNQKIEVDTKYHLVCVRDINTPLQVIYVNGVASTDTRADNLGDVSNASDLIIGDDGSGSNVSKIEVYQARLYRRALSAIEALSIANGNSIPEADEWVGVSTDLLADNQATSDQRTEGDSIASWSGLDSALATTDVGDDGVAPHDGTYKLSMTNTSTIGMASQSTTTVIGKRYIYSGWLRDPATTAIGNLKLKAGSGLGLTDLGSSDEVSIADTWQYKQIEFIATTTTTHLLVYKKGALSDITFADNLSLKQIGCVAEYHSSGLNKNDNKWYDSSTNDLDATITGAKYINTPSSNNDFYLGKFSAEAEAPFWFLQFNANGVTATATDTVIGQVAFGKAYTFPTELLPEGGYSGDYDYPGIIFNETDTGRFQTEEKYGPRPTWDLRFALSTTSQIKDMRQMVDFLKGRNFPFWISFNFSDNTPVIWRVRLDSGLSWSYHHGPTAQPWTPQLRLIKDL